MQVRICRSKIGKLACQAKSVRILAEGEYPSASTFSIHPIGWLFCLAAALVASNLAPRAKRRGIRFAFDNHWNGPTRLWRYTLRLDGFVSLHAGASEKTIVTKPFLYDGDALFINFSTSAWGSMYFTLIGEDGTRYESLETFGAAIDRRVHFENEDAVAALRSTPVTLEIRMRDADLYSLKFE